MPTFDEAWKGSVRFRKVSRELEPLLRGLHAGLEGKQDEEVVKRALEHLLVFLASEAGRTDANCAVTGRFVMAVERDWQSAAEPLRQILDDISATLHDAIYAPQVARTFASTPEQLLERVRQLRREGAG